VPALHHRGYRSSNLSFQKYEAETRITKQIPKTGMMGLQRKPVFSRTSWPNAVKRRKIQVNGLKKSLDFVKALLNFFHSCAE
jgi:hypothetical protein